MSQVCDNRLHAREKSSWARRSHFGMQWGGTHVRKGRIGSPLTVTRRRKSSLGWEIREPHLYEFSTWLVRECARTCKCVGIAKRSRDASVRRCADSAWLFEAMALSWTSKSRGSSGHGRARLVELRRRDLILSWEPNRYGGQVVFGCSF